MSRRREIAIRLALGVTRARLTLLFLADAILLALLGGAGALTKLGFVEVARSTWSLPKWTEPKPGITLLLGAEAWRNRSGGSRVVMP